MEPRTLVLALFLVRVCSARINGIPTIETVMDTDAGGELPPLLMNNVRVWLFPSMNFNCTGNITKWIFQAVASESGTMVPQMQVWRENSATPLTEDYDLQSSSGTENELHIIGDSVYEYVLNSPQSVSEGDVFGIWLPAASDREVLLQFQDFGLGGAPESFLTPQIATFLSTDGALVGPNYRFLPLVTAVLVPELTAAVAVSVDHTPTPVPETTESTQSSSPVPEPTDESDSSSGSSEQLTVGVFAGVAVVVVVGLILGVVITAVVCLRRRSQSSPGVQENRENDTPTCTRQRGWRNPRTSEEISINETATTHHSQYDHSDPHYHGGVDLERETSTVCPDPQTRSTDESGSYAQSDERGIDDAGHVYYNTHPRKDFQTGHYSVSRCNGD